MLYNNMSLFRSGDQFHVIEALNFLIYLSLA